MFALEFRAAEAILLPREKKQTQKVLPSEESWRQDLLPIGHFSAQEFRSRRFLLPVFRSTAGTARTAGTAKPQEPQQPRISNQQREPKQPVAARILGKGRHRHGDRGGRTMAGRREPGAVRKCVGAGNKAGFYTVDRYTGEQYWKVMLTHHHNTGGPWLNSTAVEQHSGRLQPGVCNIERDLAPQRPALQFGHGRIECLHRRH